MKHHYASVLLILIISGTGGAQTASVQVTHYLSELQQKGLLHVNDSAFEILSEHTSSISGIHHIRFIQAVNGLPVSGTASSIHTKNRKMVASNIRFVNNCLSKLASGATPSVPANRAVQRALSELGFRLTEPVEILKTTSGIEQQTLVSHGGTLQEAVSARLSYNLVAKDKVALVWEFLLKEVDDSHYWNVKVNAQTAEVLSKEDILFHCSFGSDSESEVVGENYNFDPYPPSNYYQAEAAVRCSECYEAFIWPVENPYYGFREISVNPAHPVASPFGWHDTNGILGPEYTITKGNNIHVKADNGYEPQGGAELNFTNFPLDINWTEQNQSESAAGTNVFYVLNRLHDLLYLYGFDEVAGNFQKNNYGRGGLDQDYMQVFAQMNSRCGSIYFPTLDGNLGHISYGVCGNKDASLDSDVLIHEYVHGLTVRLIGGGTSTGDCLRNGENLAEGFSDWYAKVINIAPDDQGPHPIGYGNYMVGEGPNGVGTNRYHYSTDLSVNPLTYANVPDDESVHFIGSIWANILWEVTWQLIELHGYDPNLHNFTGTPQDAGNIRALAIVTESLKLLGCQPGFTDGRDAVIKANELLYNRESECFIWDAFAKRGLGVNAYQGNSDVTGDEYVDFTTMPREVEMDLDVQICFDATFVRLEGGLPYGGTYSGIGVTDTGDGRTFFVETEGLDIGTYEVTYEFEGTADCYAASAATGRYHIIEDIEAPIPECPLEFTHIVQPAEEYLLWDYKYHVEAFDNCDDDVSISQLPLPNSVVEPGPIELIFTFEDNYENRSQCSCTVNLVVQDFGTPGNDGHAPYLVDMYPNPNTGLLYVYNRSVERIQQVTIYDVLGRTAKTYDLRETEIETELNIESLEKGVYFVKFSFKNGELVEQLIKK